MSEGKRLYLTLDERLFKKIKEVADAKGKTPSNLVVSNLEDLYMKNEAVDYGKLLDVLITEANLFSRDVPFLLADLPSFGELIVSTAQKAHISPSPVRARIGKSFNTAVRNKKAGNIVRATRADANLTSRPRDLLNKAGVAMYVNKSEKEEKRDE